MLLRGLCVSLRAFAVLSRFRVNPLREIQSACANADCVATTPRVLICSPAPPA